ncbi:butyrophilin subfamily 2 member A2-like [Pundamilia nyererei]|uniref:Butyrophilin subfamily 2 member A2-like n=1 Tax=Pundamilia nyererei TaxID=303518 RepID=A0A9Y3VXH5_9CICH|nr:PREDICTED: butyrophilin subfamily 2 member A2-like [Pundamilia nyererei]
MKQALHYSTQAPKQTNGLPSSIVVYFLAEMSSFVGFLSCAFFVTSALEDHTEVKVRSGQNVTLQCQGPRGLNITLLEWSKPEFNSESYVFFFQNHRLYENYQHESFRGRVALKDRSMKDGDVSVILRNVNINDTGTYSCEITTRMKGKVVHEVVHSINLKVTDSDENIKGGEEEDGNNMNKSLPLIFVFVLGHLPEHQERFPLDTSSHLYNQYNQQQHSNYGGNKGQHSERNRGVLRSRGK